MGGNRIHIIYRLPYISTIARVDDRQSNSNRFSCQGCKKNTDDVRFVGSNPALVVVEPLRPPPSTSSGL